jgi:3D-(3,5/4)-trihydroxycyclohexane-1,2-dione acylhydrolase (decyclizing)
MGKLTMTVGQALVKFLDNQYVSLDGRQEKFVDGIFTIFGHGIVCGLGQALDENPQGLKVYQGRNEQGMAHVAAGFAKQSNRRRIIACASSIGPGAANMVTAVADATANNIPLLVFTGDTYATRQPDPVLQQIEQFHDASITTSDAFRPVSRYFDRVYRPEQLMTALLNAMRTLTDPGLTGGVCISLPQDVQGETFAYPDYFFKKRIHHISRPTPEEDQLSEVVELILRKKKPLVIIGGGTRYSEAGEQVLALCEKYNIPFAETQSGKSVIASSHPLNLGGVGVTGNSAANTIASEADLIIGVGTRLTDFTTGSKELFRNPKVEFTLINVSRFHAEKLDAVPVIADARKGLQAILTELDKSDYKTAYTTEIKEAKLGWAMEMDYLTGTRYDSSYQSIVKAKEAGVEEEFIKTTGGLITQTAALGVIRELIENDAIVVGASGSLPGDLQRMWTTEVKDSYHMEYGYSCMGYEIAATLGAKLAEPERACYSMVGDGSFMMMHSEIATALQERKKITVLLFDNCGFGCINNLQMGSGMGSLATMFRYREESSGKQEGGLIATDFAMIGRGYGMTTYTVKTLDELCSALEEAKQTQNSVLIDIKVLPKSMTDGYGSWWHVGIGDSDNNEKIKASYEDRKKHLEKARMY